MTKERKKESLTILLDLSYNGSMNAFEEFYGDSVSYQELEQESYIELKTLINKELGKVKFRKAREIIQENALTCKLEMSKKQYEKLLHIYNGEILDKSGKKHEPFKFVFNFKIHNIRIEELIPEEN